MSSSQGAVGFILGCDSIFSTLNFVLISATAPRYRSLFHGLASLSLELDSASPSWLNLPHPCFPRRVLASVLENVTDTCLTTCPPSPTSPWPDIPDLSPSPEVCINGVDLQCDIH